MVWTLILVSKEKSVLQIINEVFGKVNYYNLYLQRSKIKKVVMMKSPPSENILEKKVEQLVKISYIFVFLHVLKKTKT